MQSRRIQVDFTEGRKIIGTCAQRAMIKRCITPRNIRDRKIPSQGVALHFELHVRSPYALKFETDLRKKP